MSGLATDVISNITNSGYTVRHQDGTTTDVTGSFNNFDATAFLYVEGFMQYEFNMNYILARAPGLITYKQLLPSTTWQIKHNLGVTPKVTVIVDRFGVKSVMLPKGVTIADKNTVYVSHTFAAVGVAMVR